MADDEPDPTTTRFLRWFAAVTPRRTFLGQLGRGFAWLLGAGAVGAATAWNPLERKARAQSSTSPCQGPYECVRNCPPGTPACPPEHQPNPTYGDTTNMDGCVRPDQQGMYGCDCTCMGYGDGNNDCPDGAVRPGGAVWCWGVDLNYGTGKPPNVHELCYADCFSSTEMHCTNGNGRNCSCRGRLESGQEEWEWPTAPQNHYYACTRVIDMGPTTNTDEQFPTLPAGVPGDDFCR